MLGMERLAFPVVLQRRGTAVEVRPTLGLVSKIQSKSRSGLSPTLLVGLAFLLTSLNRETRLD
jgi:hypothetical protein